MQGKNIARNMQKFPLSGGPRESETKDIMRPIENESAIVNSLQGLETSPQILERGDSPSMRLIDDSADYLFSVMKGIEGKKSEDVRSICACASEIHKLMRLKLDLLKLKSLP